MFQLALIFDLYEKYRIILKIQIILWLQKRTTKNFLWNFYYFIYDFEHFDDEIQFVLMKILTYLKRNFYWSIWWWKRERYFFEVSDFLIHIFKRICIHKIRKYKYKQNIQHQNKNNKSKKFGKKTSHKTLIIIHKILYSNVILQFFL